MPNHMVLHFMRIHVYRDRPTKGHPLKYLFYILMHNRKS